MPFTEKDVSSDPAAIQDLIRAGVQSTPAIRKGERWVIGFDQRELLALVED
ncbi:MAG: hypothetical protein HY812_05135 [Planctomycetes bacterium]|nr:hypothetical protein [Planctomycetota bacterium]